MFGRIGWNLEMEKERKNIFNRKLKFLSISSLPRHTRECPGCHNGKGEKRKPVTLQNCGQINDVINRNIKKSRLKLVKY